MSKPTPRTAALAIDARPRGPEGPLAGLPLLGQPLVAHLVDLAGRVAPGPIAIHARAHEHADIRDWLEGVDGAEVVLTLGPPPEGSAILRTDRLYDAGRLRKVLKRGQDPEAAVLWRLDGPTGLAGAEAELSRRQTYQPLGRFWALEPAKRLARSLTPTWVGPNAVTLASGVAMLTASAVVAFAGLGLPARLAGAGLLAAGLVLDTADGHLARLQGTTSDFGRWLDGSLDELCDMALHAAIAWSVSDSGRHPAWLLVGMAYAMGKYVYLVGVIDTPPNAASTANLPALEPDGASWPKRLMRLAGHADVRWHLWIVLAALGRLDLALGAYAAYFPLRALVGAVARGVRRA